MAVNKTDGVPAAMEFAYVVERKRWKVTEGLREGAVFEH